MNILSDLWFVACQWIPHHLMPLIKANTNVTASLYSIFIQNLFDKWNLKSKVIISLPVLVSSFALDILTVVLKSLVFESRMGRGQIFPSTSFSSFDICWFLLALLLCYISFWHPENKSWKMIFLFVYLIVGKSQCWHPKPNYYQNGAVIKPRGLWWPLTLGQT